jgi:hypothetical protein
MEAPGLEPVYVAGSMKRGSKSKHETGLNGENSAFLALSIFKLNCIQNFDAITKKYQRLMYKLYKPQ